MSQPKKIPFQIKALKKNELARFYDVSVTTFNKWIEPFKINFKTPEGSHYLIPKDVALIVEKLGPPVYDEIEKPSTDE